MTKPSLRSIAICALDTSMSGWSEPWDRALISDHATKLGYKVPRVIDVAHIGVEELLAECRAAGAEAVVLPSLDHLPAAAQQELETVGLVIVTVYPEIDQHAARQAGREELVCPNHERTAHDCR